MEGDNKMKRFRVFSVVVRMTSPDGNRYDRNVHIEAPDERQARVLAENEAEKDNKGFTCMARQVARA